MRKLLAILMTFAIAVAIPFTFVGCGSGGGSKTNANGEKPKSGVMKSFDSALKKDAGNQDNGSTADANSK